MKKRQFNQLLSMSSRYRKHGLKQIEKGLKTNNPAERERHIKNVKNYFETARVIDTALLKEARAEHERRF